MIEEAFSTEDLIQRDRWKRPLIIPASGGEPVPYMRASTLASALSDSSGITKWKERQVALGVGRYEDLAAMAAGLEYGKDNAELDEIVECALDRTGATAKANYGMAMHTFTEPDRDASFAPARMRPDIDAYRAVIDAAGIDVVSAERFVVCDALKVAGTYDHVYRVPAELFPDGSRERGHAGRRMHVMGDKKTGTLHMHEHAVQLAVYANSRHYDPATGGREDLAVSLDWALLVHLPRGEATAALYWVDIKAGRKAVSLALAVHEFRKSAGELSVILTPPAVKPETDARHDETMELLKAKLGGRELTAAERLSMALTLAASTTALEALWRTRKAIWTEAHTKLAAERRAQIEEGKA